MLTEKKHFKLGKGVESYVYDIGQGILLKWELSWNWNWSEDILLPKSDLKKITNLPEIPPKTRGEHICMSCSDAL